MLKIYRMWRYLRIIEKELFREPDPINGTQTTTLKCNTEFCKLRTIFRRNYTSVEGVKACFMAEKLGYAKLKKDTSQADNYLIGISGEGLKFTAYSSLLDAFAKSILSVGTIVTVIISAIALAVSIIALKH